MAKVQIVSESRASMLLLKRVTPKHTTLTFGDDVLHFFDNKPAAVLSGGIVYYESQPPAGMRVVNAIAPDAPHVREQAGEFDFLVGQILVKAGLPLTRRVST